MGSSVRILEKRYSSYLEYASAMLQRTMVSSSLCNFEIQEMRPDRKVSIETNGRFQVVFASEAYFFIDFHQVQLSVGALHPPRLASTWSESPHNYACYLLWAEDIQTQTLSTS